MKRDGATLQVQPTVEFIYYAKTVAAAEMFGLFERPSESRRVPTTRDGKFKGWGDFLNQSQEFSEEVQGQLEGLPRGSIQLELRSKSIPGQPEMITLIPTTLLSSGEYQIGIRGGSWFRLSVVARTVSKFGPSKDQPIVSQHFGPSLKSLVLSNTPSPVTALQIPPTIQQNPALPIIMKAVDAQGGIANVLLASAKRYRATGRALIEGQGFVEMTVNFYWKYPEQLRHDCVYQMKSGPFDQTLSFNSGNTYGFARGKDFSPSKAANKAASN